jgi:23S rRNA-/tRNA-specific pseudouridylate synthase
MTRFMVALPVSRLLICTEAAPDRPGAFTAHSLVSWIPMILKTDRGDAGRRIDLVLRRHLAGVGVATRTRIQDWIEAGHVSVNGAAVRRVSTCRGWRCDRVALPAAAARRPMEVEQVPLHILHEDDHLLAVDKPSGIVSHTHACAHERNADERAAGTRDAGQRASGRRSWDAWTSSRPASSS